MEQLDQQEHLNHIAKALSAFQRDVNTVGFDKKNPHFRSSYASLASIIETIKKPLADNGLTVSQTIHGDNEFMFLDTILLHISGQKIVSQMPLLLIKRDMQALGSALTYARRYSLSAILCIAADEDDDGNESVTAPKTQPAKPKEQKQVSIEDYVIPLGKNKGKKLSEVPKSELEALHDYLNNADKRNAAGEECMNSIVKYLMD
jgi:hypothetical protein